jgi:hypothetical protein
MAFIGQALGAGYTSDYQDPGYAQRLQNPNVSSDMTNNAYQQAQQGLGQQQAFVSALQGQNGIANQDASYQAFQGLANGTGPNPAQAQLAQATQANVANQAAQAAGQRGASQNVGMIARGAANAGAQAQQQSAGQAATMGAQQQVQGMQGMANISGQQVSNLAGGVQGLNQAAQSEQQNLYGAQGAYNNAQAGIYSQNTQGSNSLQTQNNKNQSGMFGGLLSGAGGIVSDKNQKKDIKPADDKIKDFLDKAGAHEYSYKDTSVPGTAPGKHVSPMAQELEKSELGKQMVMDTPNGKAVDYQRSMGTLVSALASLNKRLDSMEGGKKPASPKKMSKGGEVGDNDYETMPAPPAQKLAGGGFLYGSAPTQTGTPNASPFAQMGAPQREGEQSVQQGSNDLMKGIGDKSGATQWFADKRQGITDYFNNERSVDLDKMSMDPNANAMTGMQQNPQGGYESLDGTTATDPFGAPLPTNGAGSPPPEAPGQTGLESIGGEGATDAAAATDTSTVAAGDTAAAGEGAGAATEAAGAFEGADSAVALLASKGAHPKKKVPALVSPGEAYIPPHKVQAVASGKESVRSAGQIIPGTAKVKGDSQKNDTVKKTLAAGGAVVPRSKMGSADSAANFVAALVHHKAKKAGKR